VINGIVSLWKIDNKDQDNLIYVLSSLEDHGHNSKINFTLSSIVVQKKKIITYYFN
jgi:hypothetical protein